MARLLWLFLPLSVLFPAPAERPKIGLALAGGSALGLTHVGVLKWLDENRIPVDAVAGASMGSLIGAMYATGRSPQEIEDFVTNLDWVTALDPYTPFRQLAFRRKEDRREYPNRLEIGFKGGKVHFPVALSAGHGVGLVISRIAAGYSEMRSFDDLPIPFRCVATDLVAAKQVQFDSGDLYEALRASMSLPGVFTPFQKGDQRLVDGGIINNLPVDVVRGMGAEIIIAVALHIPLPERGNNYSIFGVFDRSLDIMLSGSEVRALAAAEIGIIPNMTRFSSADFHRVKEFIDTGYRASAAKANLLKRFALSEEDWAVYQKARQARRRNAIFEPSHMVTEGLNKPLERDLEKRLGAALAPPAEVKPLDDQLTRLAGLGRWDTVSYRILNDPNGRQTLLVKAHEKSHGPPFLNTAILIDGANAQTARFGIGGRLTFLDVFNPGSEWRTDFFIGFRDTLATEYFHRIRSSKLFVAPRGFIEKYDLDIYENNNRVAQFSTRETGAGLDIGYAAGRRSEFRLGYQLSRFTNEVSIGVPSLPSLRGNVSRARMRWIYEGQDNAIVPTKGIRLATNAQWVFSAPGSGKNGFPILEGDLRWAKPVGGAYFLTGQLSGGSSITSTNYFAPFTLGGPLRLSALAPQQLFGSHYYFSEIGILRAISPKPTQYFTRMYLTAAYELGSAFNSGGRYRPFHGGVAGVVGETPVGVLFVGGAYGEQGQRKFFVRLGRYF